MVDCYGRWKYEVDTPLEKKCDCDLIADYIMFELEYIPSTTIENLVMNLILSYEDEITNKGYFAIKENAYGDMINVDDVAEYIDACGLTEFDYWA